MKANDLAVGILSKAFAELVVVPMTCLRERETSERWPGLTGERNGVLFWKGELFGVSLRLPHAGLIIRELEGVSDIAGAREVEWFEMCRVEWTCQREGMAMGVCGCNIEVNWELRR